MKRKRITAAVLAANRANGKKSTGPKTRSGKNASRRNAWKHGMTAKTLGLGWYWAGSPTPAQNETLVRRRQRQPKTALEQAFLRRIASLEMQLSRGWDDLAIEKTIKVEVR